MNLLQILNEANNLTKAELVKDSPDPSFDYRWQILVDKIKNKQPITLSAGGEVVIDVTTPEIKQILDAGNARDADKFFDTAFKGTTGIPIFKDSKSDQMYRTSQFMKTGEFGGKGSGAGAKQTKQQEIGQCLVCALQASLRTRELTPDDITPERLYALLATNRIKSYAKDQDMRYDRIVLTNDSAADIQKTIDFVINHPQWQNVMIDSSRIITNKRKGMQKFPLLTQKYYYHRNSAWVKKLYDKFNELNTDPMTKQKYFAGGDKWNPADIWITADKEPEIGDYARLEQLNDWLLEQYKNGSIVGVSLKKTVGAPVLDVYNMDEQQVSKLLDMEIRDLVLSKTGNYLFNSKDTYLMYESGMLDVFDDETFLTELSSLDTYDNDYEPEEEIVPSEYGEEGQIQFRTFDKPEQQVQGQITGTAASHGKVGLGIINRVLTLVGIKQTIPTTDQVKTKLGLNSGKKQVQTQARLIMNDILAMAKQVNPNIEGFSTEQLNALITKKKPQYVIPYLLSKHQAVNILKTINDAKGSRGKISGKTKAHDALQELIKYASSQSEMSSVFVKVH